MTTYSPNWQPWVIKAGNTAKTLMAQLHDANGPVDLTGASVVFRMRRAGSSVNKIDDAACTIVNAATGEVSYSWDVADLDTAGNYNAEFEVTFATGDAETWPQNRPGQPKYLSIQIQGTL